MQMRADMTSAALGGSGANRMRRVAVADSGVVAYSGMKVYLVRTATLIARGGERFELGVEQAVFRIGRDVQMRRRVGPKSGDMCTEVPLPEEAMLILPGLALP